MVLVCENCGSDKIKKSKKGLGIVCCNCDFYKHYGDVETVEDLLSYEPTSKEKLINFINQNTQYIFEYGYVGDYIKIEKLLKGINEIL